MMSPLSSLSDAHVVGAVRRIAAVAPDRTALTFVLARGTLGEVWSYARLDQRARVVAASLQAVSEPQDRVLLLCPPGLDYVAAFLGCLYARRLAVPAYPVQDSRSRLRVQAIHKDASPSAVLTLSNWEPSQRIALDDDPGISWLRADTLTDDLAEAWQSPSLESEDIAFLQYTSGSTRAPRGVMVTHANLAHNQRAISQVCRTDSNMVGVSWLPPYHDMGLIGGVLHPLVMGGQAFLMAPETFLRDPLGWLDIITRTHATFSGGPDFAYVQCLRKAKEGRVSRLDLRSWETAVHGAEPIRPNTLHRFSEVFGPVGFNPHAHVPCYGLAEATLLVAGARPASPSSFCLEALRQGRSLAVRPDDPQARLYTNCGQSIEGQELLVVDPVTRRPCPSDRVGEVWVRGPSVARGYWNRPEETRETFGACLEDPSEGPFLRTGDLGVLDARGLHITGRRKDLIIIRGQNVYPQDVESAVEDAVSAVRPDSCVAFGMSEADHEERLAVVAAIRSGIVSSAPQLASEVRAAVARECFVEPSVIVFVPPGAIPKTSSGKLQRAACRQAWIDGRLEVLYQDDRTGDPDAIPDHVVTPNRQDIDRWLRERVAARAGLSPEEVDFDQPLASLGIDSIQLALLLNDIERATGHMLELSSLLGGATLAAISNHLRNDREAPAESPPVTSQRATSAPLSVAQQRLWLEHHSKADASDLGLVSCVALRGNLDVDLLRRSLERVVARHDALRTLFVERDGEIRQEVQPQRRWDLPTIDLGSLSSSEQQGELTRRVRLHGSRQVDLEKGPLLVTELLHLGPREHQLLLALHHILSDGWSMSVMAREVRACYEAFCQGNEPSLPPPPFQYGDFARWQLSALQVQDEVRHREAWRQRLQGAAPLVLPVDRWTPVRDTAGRRHAFRLEPAVVQPLRALARSRGATLFAVLLTIFKTVLLRHSMQEDLCVGTVAANRLRPEFEDLIGFFVHTLPIRTQLSASDTFLQALDKVSAVVLESLAHQALPFESILEEAHAPHQPGRVPLLDALFVLQNTPPVSVALPGVDVEVISVDSGTANVDLAWDLTQKGEAIQVVVAYRTALFDSATIERLARVYRILAGRVVQAQHVPLGRISLLDDEDGLPSVVHGPVPAGEFNAVHDHVAVVAAAAPEAVAVIAGERTLTYGALVEGFGMVANALRAAGVGTENRIGLLTSRSFAFPMGWLAILAAGGVVLALDPAQPSGRMGVLLDQARPGWLLVESSCVSLLDASRWEEVWRMAPAGKVQEQLVLFRDRVGPNAPATDAGVVRPGQAAYVLYTSGSAGAPKGVVVSHGALSNLCDAQSRGFGLGRSDRVLQFASPAFDASVSEVFVTLWGCSTLVMMPSMAAYSTELLLQTLVEQRVTVATLPPAVARLLPSPVAFLRTLVLAGEAVDGALAERMLDHHRVINAYGPTEGAVCATMAECRGDERGRVPPIGAPIGGVSVYVLDEGLRPVPAGVPGEVFLGGRCVARGYDALPGRTAASFLPDPFSSQAGARMYRTGDRGRWRTDGDLEFLGRLDGQVKVRGVRVEPGEVEAALCRHAQVLDAVVRLDPRSAGEPRLVAWVHLRSEVTEEAAGASEASRIRELRRHLEALLPAPMVPSLFVAVDGFARTPSGKKDPEALRIPDDSLSSDSEYVAPRCPIEVAIANRIGSLLGRERVGVLDDFFDLGGHSLMASQLVTHLKVDLGISLPVRVVFEARTVASLAQRVRGLQGGVRRDSLPPLVPVPRTSEMLSSHAQTRLWFLHQVDPTGASYNMPLALRVRGNLRLDVLHRVLCEILRRHESLRTGFVAREGTVFQRIHDDVPWRLTVEDLTGLEPAEQSARIATESRAEARKPFDLSSPPLLRAKALRLTPAEYLLLFTMHHITSDGWSAGVFHRELSDLYGAFASDGESPLAPLSVQVADFAHWQRSWLRDDLLHEQLEFWKAALRGLPDLRLPTDRPRPSTPSFRGGHCTFSVDEATIRGLGNLAHRADATLFMVLAAAWYLLLHRLSGQSDFGLGTPVANRVHPALEPLIGFFVNTVVLRIDGGGDPTFLQLLHRVRATTLDSLAHQDLPFDRLVEALPLRRDGTHNPLFQVMIALQNAPSRPLRVAGLEFEPAPLDTGTSRFDLLLSLEETDSGFRGILEYASDLLDRASAERIAALYKNLLSTLVQSPERRLSRYSLRSIQDRKRLTSRWAAPVPLPASRVHALDRFVINAGTHPSALALVLKDEAWSYGELYFAAKSLANRLREAGIGPEKPVGLLCNRSCALIVGMIGILLSSGVLVPLPPDYPSGRLEFMIDRLGIRTLVRENGLSDLLPGFDGSVLEVDLRAGLEAEWTRTELSKQHRDSLAYVLFTSGSTGSPKPVGIPHGAAHAFLAWVCSAFGQEEMACVLAGTSCAFDLSIFEILGTLSAGGTVSLVEDVLHVEERSALAAVTLINTVPSAMRELLRLKAVPDSVVTVNLAGEPLTADLVGSLYALPGVRRVMNLYGPTETTTYSSFAVAGKGKPGSVPIGVGIEGTVVYVLDRNLAPAVPGELGEICIGGLGVARGILGDAVTTARRFLPDPFSPQPGARMYRTGDMARVGPDRSLVFSGRMDDQVKIRGVRVELQEVETTLREFPGVADAAVLPRGGDGVEIAAYVVPRTGWGDDDLLAQEQIRHWRSVYDENYGVTSMDPRFDTRGWVSRFSGRPYDLVDMREWVDGTAGRIRALGGRRILEIGCGTGLLLFALLDRASAYDATDFSQAALEGIRRGLTAEEACKVRLFHCDAGDLSALPGDSYDVVVINSVVQYLPRVGDVIALLDAAHGKLAPGGRLFVGDVRNAELLETLHFAVQLAQAPPEDDVRDVVVRGREKVRNDAELALSPAFFAVWARRKQGVRARLMARTGPSLTEMNLYRYDVVLGPADPPAEPPRIHPWSAESELDVEEIARRSAAKGETVVLSDVPDGRLAALVSLVEEEVATGPGRPRTVRGVREGLARGLVAGVDLVSVLEAVGRGGCEADVTPHDSRGRCSLVLWAKGIGAPPTCWTGEEGLALHSLGNDPLSPRRDARLAAALREHLSRRLPEAMIPTVLLIVLEMPRTPGGKVDRGALHALGAPARPKSEYRAPSTPLESELALIFADLLRVDRVGVDDDFFELGGHSLLATQLVSRIRERYGANLPLRRVFEIPSVRGLAQALSEEAAVGAPAGAEEEEEGEL